ncbi:MAG: MarR family transcriptional regulator [Pseudomonadota bacterium]
MAKKHAETDALTVEELICFALYSANHAMNKAYKPHLTALGLTYPQYITLTALWDRDGITVGALCDRLLMETSTITPILKRLEAQGHVERKRGKEDERQVFVHLTASGRALEAKAPEITACIIDDTGVPQAKLEKLVQDISAMRDSLERVD